MIKQIAVKATNILRENYIIDINQYNKSIFGLEIMLTTIFQFGGLIIFSIAIEKIYELFFFFIPFIVLRFSAGGYHANTAIKCFIYSLGSFLIALCIINFVKYHEVFTYSSLLISYILLVKYAPQDTPNKPFKEGEKERYKEKSRKIIVIIFIFLLVLNSIDFYKIYVGISAIGVMFESISLLPMHNKISRRKSI